MINNGGGLFDKEQKPNIVTKANIEAVNFVLECVSKGYVDPSTPSYTNANVQAPVDRAEVRDGIGHGRPRRQTSPALSGPR